MKSNLQHKVQDGTIAPQTTPEGFRRRQQDQPRTERAIPYQGERRDGHREAADGAAVAETTMAAVPAQASWTIR